MIFLLSSHSLLHIFWDCSTDFGIKCKKKKNKCSNAVPFCIFSTGYTSQLLNSHKQVQVSYTDETMVARVNVSILTSGTGVGFLSCSAEMSLNVIAPSMEA